jgi:2-oxoglutarate ferredoxin oxidoreductase subunit beta
MRKVLEKLERKPTDILLVSGIGQAAKLPHYLTCNCFNGLHGRALPVAAAAKMANRELTVIVTTGDGDCYGEGGNHFIHNIRRNVDITVVVHNNQIYGLTKGQASPTTEEGYVTPVQTGGVILEPFRALQTAITLGAGFVARGFSGDLEHLSEMIVRGVGHRGFSLIEVLQPCVSFNRKNTHKWYKERVEKLEDGGYDPGNITEGWKKAGEWGDRIPIGVIYRKDGETYGDKSGLTEMPPLADHGIGNIDIGPVLDEKRV